MLWKRSEGFMQAGLNKQVKAANDQTRVGSLVKPLAGSSLHKRLPLSRSMSVKTNKLRLAQSIAKLRGLMIVLEKAKERGEGGHMRAD